ncbi:DUF6044 family protein [Hyphobacterium sp. SN044]|uniref:DUF6044 family protein n=1 Tax=Hyphobacterium sp. SN044 TaxID=2912575 RepID=UPI001F4013E1|nr:DUF6044 family protein [Hyphobacterium sp. SN044]MCF8879057.1 DUF6044 family protein [Hyphobacterium sp. SN044]
MSDGMWTRWMQRDRLAYIVGFAILLVVALVAYFPPHNLSIEGNDQLDSVIPLYETLPSPLATLFRPGYVHDQLMHGLPLDMMGVGDLKIVRLIYGIFPQYWDTSIYFTVALLALYLSAILPFQVARRHFAGKPWMPQLDPAAVAFGAGAVALMPHSFAVLGAIIGFNLFVAGAMLSLVPNRTWSALGLFLLAAMFADFVLGGLFYYPAALVAFAIFGGMNGNWRPLKLVALGLLITIFIEYRLFWGLLFSDTESHRVVWMEGRHFVFGNVFNGTYWTRALTEAQSLINGTTAHYHYQWNTALILPVTTGVAILAYILVWSVVSVRGRALAAIPPSDTRLLVWIAGTMALMGLVAFGFGIVQSNMLDFEALVGVPVQLSRFIVVLPFLSVVLLAVAVHLASEWLWWGVKTGLVAVALGALAMTIHVPLERRLDNIAFHAEHGWDNPYVAQYTVGTYFSRGMYDEVRAYLGADWPEERVVTVGLPTMAAAYNGFHTLDGYYQAHPLDFHLAFRRVIAPALERDPARASNYDGWGNRVEVPVTTYNADGTIEVFIDGCALADIGGTLVLSQYQLSNPDDSQLRREAFISGSTDGLTGNIFLYRPACGEAVAGEADPGEG